MREAETTVAFIQDWLMNADYDPTQFDKDFAAAIDARVNAGIEAAAKVAEDFEGSASLERADDPCSATGQEIAENIRLLIPALSAASTPPALIPIPKTAKDLTAIIEHWLAQDCDWGEWEKALNALCNTEDGEGA